MAHSAFTTDVWNEVLAQARSKAGDCAPNPSVGCAIVKNGRIVALGHHRGPGTDHAEVDALRRLSASEAKGAEVFVSLEPCCHTGRTPPCTDALIRAGVSRVFFSEKDPNPVVDGKGRLALLNAGIGCAHTPIAAITDFYQPYRHWTLYRQAWITAKLATSLDGFVAGVDRKPVAITGELANAWTHEQRAASDAILTTCKTVLYDDPQLNVRLQDGRTFKKPIVIMDRLAQLPLGSRIFETAASLTILHGIEADETRLGKLRSHGVACHGIRSENGKLDWNAVASQLGRMGFHQVWFEGGTESFDSFVQSEIAGDAYVLIGNRWLGQGTSNLLDISRVGKYPNTKLGHDVLLRLDLKRSCLPV